VRPLPPHDSFFLSFLLLVIKLRIEVNIENATTNQMAIEGIEKYLKWNKSALSKTISSLTSSFSYSQKGKEGKKSE